MTILDLDKLSSGEVIAQYIVELREKGHMLPYDDYRIVKEWLCAIDNNDDQLLLILSDILPEYYSKRRGSGPPPSLKGVHKSILKNIKEVSARNYS